MKKKKDNYVLLDMPVPDTTAQERMVLADVVQCPEAMDDMVGIVNQGMFTSEARAGMWSVLLERYNSGESNDFASVFNLIGDAFKEEVVPSLSRVDGTATSFVSHAAALRDGAARRRAYLSASAFIHEITQPGVSESDILAEAESFSRSLEGASSLQLETSLYTCIQDVRASAQATEKAVADGESLRVTTGFYWVDLLLNGGMKPGQLVILAARPSVGKTALMLQMAKNAAIAGAPVLIFSLEMTSEELAERLLFSTGRVRPYHLSSGRMDWPAFDEAELELSPLQVYLNDFSRSLDEISSRLTMAVKRGRCRVAFIDYLGLIHDALNFGCEMLLYQVVARITGTFKALAKRLRIPVVLLCQLNRDSVRQRDSGKPRPPELFDLRDSGSIEQDADVVLMLENRIESEGHIVAWLRKNRSGRKNVGIVLRPNDTYTAFDEGEVIGTDRRQVTIPQPAGYKPVPVAPPAPEPPLSMEEGDDLPF